MDLEERRDEGASENPGTFGSGPLAELARFEQGAYRLFSAALRYPEPDRLKLLEQVAGELAAEADSLAAYAFYPAWKKTLQTLQGLDELDRGQLAQEYVRFFLLGSGGSLCPPYASHWLDPEGGEPGLSAARVERKYGEAGLALSPALGDLPDHASVELEFMSYLCRREAEAWEGDFPGGTPPIGIAAAGEKALALLQRRLLFMDRHLCRWFPRFARAVSAAANRESGARPEPGTAPKPGPDSEPEGLRDGFYPVVTSSASSFLNHDRELLKLKLRLLRAPGRSRSREARRHGGNRNDS